ncbi:hypothetical protein KUCAC02_020998 [Chaenocephalus aceratus]|uniref:Uncharacterized protein n=1 Tax=Chaenocephalus aceratus TaxID=36190 RepID=A0ACB9XFF5_CHAAC|nr:hypothetical protein KUCAC02_020998 [Chaenocephalus aceratus]
MQRNQRPKPGPNAAVSPEEDKAGKENATFVMRIEGLEEGANCYANRVVELEAKVTTLSSQVNKLVDKTEDLESRQRRDNCRLVGVAEGTGNIRPEKAIAQLLQDALSLDYTLTLDHAHRGLQPKPADGDAPRPIIIKFHYFQEESRYYTERHGSGAHLPQRQAFLHLPGLHALATLKITTSAGEQKSFEDPTKAKHYIETDLHPRDTEGE